KTCRANKGNLQRFFKSTEIIVANKKGDIVANATEQNRNLGAVILTGAQLKTKDKVSNLLEMGYVWQWIQILVSSPRGDEMFGSLNKIY
ncbi:hypothetical protein ACJX0J_027045, partial [Zea mays]